MHTSDPKELDDKLVKAFVKSLRKTRETLSKYRVNGVSEDKVPVNDRVGVWCTHLRNELFHIGDGSRQHSAITTRLCNKSQWDDAGVVKMVYERKTSRFEAYDTGVERGTGTYAYHWLLEAHGTEGVWRMNNTRLAELVKKAKRSPDYATSLESQTDNINSGIKSAESELQAMMDLLQEHNDLNDNADKVVEDLCRVAEEMVA